MKNNLDERIYGIDPGCLKNPREIMSMDEVSLFLQIEILGTSIFNKFTKNKKADTTEEEYALAFCVYQTKKFGVTLPEARLGKRIPRTDSYDSWYKYYHNHFYNKLNKEELNRFLDLRSKGKNGITFLPNGSWKDILN